MKNLKRWVITFIVGVVLAACTSTDSLVEQYEKACANHDTSKAMKIASKLEDKKSELSASQVLRITNASIKLYDY